MSEALVQYLDAFGYLTVLAAGFAEYAGVPIACVLNVEERVDRLGPAYVLPAKFIPGAGNLIAGASALSGMRPSRFVVFDAVALLLWAGGYTLTGVLFASQIQGVIVLVLRYQRWAVTGAAVLVVGAGAWRAVRIMLHRTGHAAGNEQDGDEAS